MAAVSPPSARALANTKSLVVCAIACAIAVPASISLGAGALFVMPLLWIGQLALGFTAFAIGRRGAKAAEALGLPVELAETRPLWNWSAYGLIVALLGIVGAVIVGVLGVLVIGALGAMGGAWGRPLRIAGEDARASLELGDGAGTRWAAGARPELAGLDADTRAALGRMWLHDAMKEHGSVPAFAQLTWDLAALGAPASLLERAQSSALQEIEHARRCFAAAEAYLGASVSVGPIAAASAGLHRRGGLLRCATRVALETLEDGCLIEGVNADFAARAHARATDPTMRALTACIAAEEREHAELAWDILRFCVALDPAVAAAVRRRLTRLPDHILIPYDVATAATIARADATALCEHGRVPFSEWPEIYARARAQTIERAHAVLAGVEPAAPPRAA